MCGARSSLIKFVARHSASASNDNARETRAASAVRPAFRCTPTISSALLLLRERLPRAPRPPSSFLTPSSAPLLRRFNNTMYAVGGIMRLGI